MKALRLLGWFVGVLVIGALGNALWELALLHFYSWTSRSLLTLVTLGLDSMRNSIYADVAQGHHEIPSLYILTFFVAFWTSIPFGYLLFLILTRIRSGKSIGEEHRPWILSSRILFNVVLIYHIFLGVVVLSQFIMINYTNRAITHFEHSLTICVPYLTLEEERALRSQFAQIKTSIDYDVVIRRLHAVATQQGITLREFTIW